MTVYNLGSINADHFYRLPHLPVPGETLAALSCTDGLGGKGANQSVAAARAGAEVRHIGAIGENGLWMKERLAEAGVNCDAVETLPGPSGHAIILIDEKGENMLIVHPGANRTIADKTAEAALSAGKAGEWLIMQNETSAQIAAARKAREKGMRVAYSAAPFDAESALEMLPHISLLMVNQVESEQLCAALHVGVKDLPLSDLVVTQGSKGATWHALAEGKEYHVPARRVKPVDTSGAGDTFAGYLVAALAEGQSPEGAMELASTAAALQVTRVGTADVIPTRAEVEAFRAAQPSE